MSSGQPRGMVANVAFLTTIAIAAVLVSACSGPILANAPATRPTTPPSSPLPSVPADPVPVMFHRDDGPHHRLNEWWYYTGHLRDETGHRWGFEFVIFRAERGDFPVSWASHLAFTDETDGTFRYAQRSEVGPQVDRSDSLAGAGGGFSLAVAGDQAAAAGPGGFVGAGGSPTPLPSSSDPLAPETPWVMTGSGGVDRIAAAVDATETAGSGSTPVGELGLQLDLRSTKLPALHGGVGWIDFGPAGSSYYYSRTRLAASGSLAIGEHRVRVDGMAWFDHQWGDFIAVGAGGWDWFALQLGDGSDLTLSLVRGPNGADSLVYGTLVDPSGRFTHLDRSAFSVEVTRRWTSPATGVAYPAGWIVRVPGERLIVQLSPTVAGQELDTRATTGVIYWEGSQRVTATRDGRPIGGEAYVELTGYDATRP